MSSEGLGYEEFWSLCCTAVHQDKSIRRCFSELLCLKKSPVGQAKQNNLPAGHLQGHKKSIEPEFSLQCLHHLL